ncbi:hypothetical protein ACEPPN_010875 [Leptodophora sp. 'Broadleaf-Isolate-01']
MDEVPSIFDKNKGNVENMVSCLRLIRPHPGFFLNLDERDRYDDYLDPAALELWLRQ